MLGSVRARWAIGKLFQAHILSQAHADLAQLCCSHRHQPEVLFTACWAVV